MSAVKKPRVLYLCNQAPWLRNGGSMLRNYWMIDALAKRFVVDMVVADEPGPMPAEFAALIDDYACFPRVAGGRSTAGRMLRVARPGNSTLTAGWTGPAMREHVANRLGRHPYAAIQVDLPMLHALPRLDAIPIAYNAHNCESALLARRAAAEPPHIAAMLRFDALRVRTQERVLIARSSLVAACAESDLVDFERFAPGVRAKAAIIPNGVDVRQYAAVRTQPSEPRTVLITGSMDWRPNVLGLRWFLRRGLGRLRARVPDVIVRVAGRMNAALVAELMRYPNVQAVQNPPSMEPLLGRATVVAAPIVASSGTRLRILEAWAAGRPVVTTPAGAFGLECTPGRELMVADQPELFADALAELIGSAARREALVAAAVERVKPFDWPCIGAGLLAAYDRFASDGPSMASVQTVKEDSIAMSW